MNRWVPILAVAAVLATAAFVRPPRAMPAFSLATAAPTLCCHPEPIRLRYASHSSAQDKLRAVGAKSRGHRNHHSHQRFRPAPPHDVDLNRADVTTLARVPGISEGFARRIVAYRDLVGPFESLSDLDDLDGISSSRLDTLARYLVVR